MAHIKTQRHYRDRLKETLDDLSAAIDTAELRKDFIATYIAQKPKLTYTQVVFDSLMDAYIDMTIGLEEHDVPVEPYRMMLEIRDEGPVSHGAACQLIQNERARQMTEDYPFMPSAPAFVTVFGTNPRVEVLDIMPKWKAVVACLSDALNNDISRSVQNRAARYSKRVSEVLDKEYEPHMDGLLKSSEKNAGPYNLPELNYMMARAENLDLPQAVMKRIKTDLKRMDGMHPTSGDYNSMMHPLLVILELPWNRISKLDVGIKDIEARMNEKHAGLHDVKKIIAEHQAVQARTQSTAGKILCFNGPPGIGKTSLVETIAYATGRTLVRMALGGVRDVVDIRGHSSTYVNAQAGRILKGMVDAGVKNPVFLLDEIDKLDPASHAVAGALLEVLDPQQNKNFRDTFVGVEFDLSHVMFIATSNDSRQIIPALYDRMEVVNLPAYNVAQKLDIAQKHLLPKQMKRAGLTGNDMALSPDALKMIVDEYVREPGVRELERLLEKLCRKSAYRLETTTDEGILINPKHLSDFLGKPRHRKPVNLRADEAGVVNGLGVTGGIGSALPFEVVRYKSDNGHFRISATGQMGHVMKESIDVVTAWLRANIDNYNISAEQLNGFHLHIDAPDDIAKDGPSAGTAIATACLSALTGTPIRTDLAMTGKMSIKGRVLAIGGTLAKIEGAMKDGMTTVLIPQENADDLAQVSYEIKAAIQIITVSRIEEVLAYAMPHKPLRLVYDAASSITPITIESDDTPPQQGPVPEAHNLPAPQPGA